MRDFELYEPAALVYCPARSLLHLPTWADRRRVFERVAAALEPGWPVRLERVRLRPPGRQHGSRAAGRSSPMRHRIDVRAVRTTGSRSRSRTARVSRCGGSRAASGKACSTSPASRRRRSTAGSTGGRSTSRAASSSGSPGSPRDPLRPDRGVLRPVEPLGHRGRRLLRGRGARVRRARRRARRRHGPHRRSGGAGRDRRHRRRLLAGDARGRAARPPRRPESRNASTCASATSASRPSASASRSSSARSARCCTWRPRTRSCARCAPPASLLEPGGRFVFDVFSPSREDIEETDGRWIEREPGIFERADWDEASRTLTLSVRSDESVTSFGLHWLSLPEWLRLLDEAGLRRRCRLRLVRPPPSRRRRGHGLRRPRID